MRPSHFVRFDQQSGCKVRDFGNILSRNMSSENQQLCTKSEGVAEFINHDTVTSSKTTEARGKDYKPRKWQSDKMKTYPELETEHWKSIEDVVALTLRMDALFWVKISRDLKVKDWAHIGLFTHNMPSKFDHVKFFDQLEEAIDSIPEASLYVMENSNIKLQSLKMLNSYTNLVMLKSMFLTMMTRRSSVLSQPSMMELHDLDSDVDWDIAPKRSPNYVCMLHPNDISQCFNLLVGGERTNVVKTVDNIIDKTDSVHYDVDIPLDLLQHYNTMVNKNRYIYANTLLFSIAFIRKVISHTSSNT